MKINRYSYNPTRPLSTADCLTLFQRAKPATDPRIFFGNSSASAPSSARRPAPSATACLIATNVATRPLVLPTKAPPLKPTIARRFTTRPLPTSFFIKPTFPFLVTNPDWQTPKNSPAALHRPRLLYFSVLM
ncbi:MAG: hypothetical protein CK538_02235 [Opitutia bacterium]|nr:MAG: hypothetical protein CK538_02235 [Opitutae bacterium]